MVETGKKMKLKAESQESERFTMEKKTGDRNIDTAKARGEMEEDLLEYVYRIWRQGRTITTKEYSREAGITGYEARGLVRILTQKGYFYETEKKENLELTEKGKLKGMDCLARHEKLTQFFQMVSGMNQQRAEEDACRVEHYISTEGLKGIEDFMQYGDVYDRVYDDMDLYTAYGIGEFSMAFGLYEPERRNPRFLAPEYGKLESSVILKIGENQNCYLLRTKKEESLGFVWYRREEEWIQAKMDNGTYQLPTDIFTYTANTGSPITEAVAIIAITRFEEKPLQIDYRELNIHVW